MGLDGVEIVIEVEDRFGITIRDSEAQSIRTVGDLLALISARIAARADVPCPSLGAFLKVRQLVRNLLSNPALRLRPSTKIASVVPKLRRRELWSELSNLIGSQPHPLRRPRPLRIVLIVLSCVFIGCGLATALIDPMILPLGIISSIGIVITLHLLTSPLRIEPPATMETFGHIAQRLVGISMATRPVTSADEVLTGVQSILADILAVHPDKVIPEARLIEDLDMA